MIRNLKPLLSSISRQQIVNARVVTRTYTVSRRTTATTTTGHSSVFQPSIQHRTFASDATTNNTTNTTTSTTNDANNTVDINASSSEPIVASDSKTINQPTIADKFASMFSKTNQTLFIYIHLIFVYFHILKCFLKSKNQKILFFSIFFVLFF